MADIEADDAVFMIATMKDGGTGTIEAPKITTGANDELRFAYQGVVYASFPYSKLTLSAC